jgi:hypothetical protein
MKTLNEEEGNEQCRVEIVNMFAVFENLDYYYYGDIDTMREWEAMRKNIKI